MSKISTKSLAAAYRATDPAATDEKPKRGKTRAHRPKSAAKWTPGTPGTAEAADVALDRLRQRMTPKAFARFMAK